MNVTVDNATAVDSGHSGDSAVLFGLSQALFTQYGTIFIGYLVAMARYIPPSAAAGYGAFLGKVSLPFAVSWCRLTSDGRRVEVVSDTR